MPRIGLNLPTLIQAATEIADNLGFEAVTLALLAQKLKIRSPSLYNHVKGLPDLRRHLAFSGIEKMLEQLVIALTGKSGDDAFRAFCYGYLSFARAHPGLYESVQRAAAPDDKQLQEAGGEVVGMIVKVLNDYGLEGDAAIHAVRGLRSLLHGFSSLEKQGAFGLPLDLDVSFRLLIDTFLEGIKVMQAKVEE